MTTRKAAPSSIHSTLREALADLVHRSDLKAGAQAEFLGISYSYLCNAANPNLDGQGFDYQLRLLIPHTTLTSNFSVLDFLEQAVGRVAFAPPADRRRLPADLRQGLLLITKELGEAVAALERGLKDGKLSAGEVAMCRKELFDVCTAAMSEMRALGELPC